MAIIAKGIYDFEGAQDGDLRFGEDDIITVLKKDESGWWTGRTQDGREGDFPFNYVVVLSDREAEKYQRSNGGGDGRSERSGGKSKGRQATVSFSGDRVTEARVVKVDKRPDGKYVFKVDAMTKSGKRKSAQKTLSHFRDLDNQLRRIFPSFDGVLPPAWADSMGLGDDQLAKRRRVLDHYLEKLIHTEGVDFLLMTWLFPGEKVELSGGLGAGGSVSKGGGSRDRAGSKYRTGAMPIMAKVQYNWEPKDEVELKLRKGDYIAVLEQKTGSPGWWEGQCPEGNRGLFPYNHVKLVEPGEARAVLNGQSVGASGTPKGSMSPMKRLSGKMGKSLDKVKQKMAPSSNKPRRKKVIPNFSLATLKAFDDLIDKGWCIEGEGQAAPKANGPTAKNGDEVNLHYTGYLWDCQKQCIVEFASSDDPSGDGPMVFKVGSSDTIAAINQAVQLMSTGMKIRLACTPKQGYGDVGAPPAVPPNSHLVYDLKMVEFGRPGAGGGSSSQSASSKPPSVKPRQTNPAQGSRSGNRGRNTHSVNMRPVPARSRRETHGKPNGGGYGGAPRVQVKKGGGAAPPPKSSSPKKVYSLSQLKQMVREKKLEKYGLDPTSLEDYLSDNGFQEAFGCDRGTFLLKPGWRQKAMKRTAGLF